jgi:hypothetical protein
MKMDFDSFKEKVNKDSEFKSSLSAQSDSIDLDNGSMIIHRCNLNKHLEKWMCKSEEDLIDTLWYSHGVFVKVVD